jgi:hypothetical protein
VVVVVETKARLWEALVDRAEVELADIQVALLLLERPIQAAVAAVVDPLLTEMERLAAPASSS